MSNEYQGYNIVSKLDFKSFTNGFVSVDTFKDENTAGLLTWQTMEKSNLEVTESNGVKVFSIKSNNAKIYVPNGQYGNIQYTNFKNINFDMEIELLIPNVKSGNIFFGCRSPNNGMLLFNIRNSLIGGIELFAGGGRHVRANYKFENNVKYNINVVRRGNRYTFYVDGLAIGTSKDATLFNTAINTADNIDLTIGSAFFNSSDNDQFVGSLYGFNFSVGGDKRDNKSYTKYGKHLVSRYNFAQQAWDNASTTTSCEIEAVYNAPFKWNYNININANSEWYNINKNKFSSNIDDTFTIQFNMSTDKKLDVIDLANFGTYKLKYELIKVGSPQPEVIVNENTVSAIDYEDGMTDKKGIEWNGYNGSGVQSNNVIFGDYSLEIKDDIDSFVDTTSNFISGQPNKPLTIEFYSVIKGNNGGPYNWPHFPLFTQSGSGGNTEHWTGVDRERKFMYLKAYNVSYPTNSVLNISQSHVNFNEINKYTFAYDGNAIRLFVNDDLHTIYGCDVGWTNTGYRIRLMQCLVQGFDSYRFGATGLIDNLNVFDGECRKVRKNDEYEDYLVTDLQFDGYNMYKVTDNAPSKPTWDLMSASGNYVYQLNDRFDTGTTYFRKYSNNASHILSKNVDMDFGTGDFTIQFEFYKASDDLFCNFLSTATTDYASQQSKTFYFGLFGSGYTGIPQLARKLSFFNEKTLDEVKDKLDNNTPNVLISNRIIEIGSNYKVEVVRKSGIMYLYINNVLDRTVEFPMAINLSPQGIGTSVGGIPFSTGAGLNGGINYIKAYKGIAIFPKYSETINRLTSSFDNNYRDMTGDYWRTKSWNPNGTVTFSQNPYEYVNGYALRTGEIANSYVKSGKNDLLNYGNGNFDISFDVKNIKPDNENGLEVIVASGETSFSGNNTEIQVIGFHYQSNDYGNVTKQNDLKSNLMFGYSFNNTDYLQSVKTIRNTFYKVNQLRIGNALVQKVNDVVCNVTNFNFNLPINFNKADNTYIGKCLWRGNDVGTAVDSQFKGFIDNFKSIKDDLTRDISKFSNSTSARIENKYNYLSIAPFELNKFAVAQLDDSPRINRGTIEVEFFVDSNIGTKLGLCIGNYNFSNTVNDTYGYIMTIEADSQGIFTGFYKGSENGQSSSMININRSFPITVGAINNAKIVMTDNGIDCFINGTKVHTITTEIVSRKTPIALRNWMSNAYTSNPDNEMKIKSVKVLNSLGAEIYYRDWKTSIENTIDRPTIDLPLIKHSLHFGTSKLTADHYSSGPEYKLYQGRECAVMGSNRSLFVNTTNDKIADNPFNFGSNSDFYLEMDFFIEDTSPNKNKYHSLLCDYNNASNLGGQLAIGDANDVTYSSKLYFRRIVSNENISLISTNKIIYGQWNKLKFYRKDNIVYLDLNDEVVNQSFNAVDFSGGGGTSIGRASFNYDADLNGAISNFIMFSGRSDKPENYDSKEVLNIDFSPTRKSYLFKDKFNKHVIHPVNIKDREYYKSKYGVRLSGDEQWLQVGKTDALNFINTGDFLMEFKFDYNYSDSKVAGNMLISNYVNGNWDSTSRYLIVAGGSQDLHNVVLGGWGLNTRLQSSNKLNDGYNEVILYRLNNVFHLIVNGIDTTVAGDINNGYFDFNAGGRTYIGRSGWASDASFKGVIHSVKIFRDTADLSLLEETGDINKIEEVFTLTNGNIEEDKTLTYPINQERRIQITSDVGNMIVQVDNDILEVAKNDSIITKVDLFDNYVGKIKDVRVYDVPFIDRDEFLGTDWIDTEYPEIEYIDGIEELQVYDIGDFAVKGFIEGYLDMPYTIFNRDMNYIILSGVEDYEVELDETSIGDIEIHANGQRYPINTIEMIKGYISGTVNLKQCNVLAQNMEVFCYRSDTFRHIGTYQVDENGAYEIPNLDVNSRYDIIFRDKNRTIKDQLSNYRKPVKY